MPETPAKTDSDIAAELERLRCRLAESEGRLAEAKQLLRAMRSHRHETAAAGLAGLVSSEEALRLFIEHAPVALAMFDRQMRYICVSRRWLQNFGLTGESQVVGRSHYELFPEIPERWKRFHQRGLAGEVLENEAEPFHRRDGSVQWVRWELRPWYSGGAVGGIVIFSEDVTQRKRAEIQHRDLADSIPALLWAADVQGVTTYHNRRWHEYTGLPLERGHGDSWKSIVFPGDLERVAKRWARSVRTGEDYSIEYRLRRADGDYRWHSVQARLSRDEQGTPLGWFGTLLDIHDRRQAEEKLRRSEARFRALFENSLEGILLTCPDGGATAANSVACQMFRMTEEEICRAGRDGLVAPEDPRYAAARAERNRAGKVKAEMELLRADGTTFIAAVSSVVLRDETPWAFVVLRDITESKQAEARLRQARLDAEHSAAQLRTVLNSMAERLYVCDGEGRVLVANEAARSSYPGRHVSSIRELAEYIEALTLDGRPLPLEQWPLSRVVRGERVRACEIKVRSRGSGEERVLSCNGGAIFDDQGKVAMAVLTSEDITERTHAEEALRLSEENRARIFAISPAAIVITQLEDGCVMEANEAFASMFGCPREEILGRSARRFWGSWKERSRLVEQLRDNGFFRGTEQMMRRADGTLFPALGSATLLNVLGEWRIIFIWIDISDLKRTQQALLQTEKLATVGRMASSIAHEINNPLESVGHAIYLAHLDTQLQPQTRVYLELAAQELERVAHITRQTLSFHRDNNRPRLVDLRETLDSIVQLFASRLKARKITVEKRYTNFQPVLAFESELRQVISNLLSNAMDAISGGGTIYLRLSTVLASDGSRRTRMTVADTGCGIPPEMHKKIFEAFFTTKEIIGTGLGLWVTRQIVDKNGATIRVHSVCGRGTVLSISFPAGGAENLPLDGGGS